MNKLDIEDGGHSRPHHSDWRRFSPRAAPRLPTVDTGGRAQPRVCEPGHLARPLVAALELADVHIDALGLDPSPKARGGITLPPSPASVDPWCSGLTKVGSWLRARHGFRNAQRYAH